MATKVKTCISCDKESFDAYCEGLIKCMACGLVVAEELPSDKEIQKLYEEDYFFGKEYFDYKADRSALERNFKKRMKRLSFMLSPEFDVVELGCAYGYFLGLVDKHVKSSKGFDVSSEGVEHAKSELGVDATTEDFVSYQFKPNSVDSIFMWDVAEHLAYPDKYVKKISEILKPGGHVALTTGNVDAWLPRRRGGKWRMIHPPTHVYYFSPRTLRLLFKKHGLELVSVKHTSVSRNVGSAFNQIINNRKALGKSTGLIGAAHAASKNLGANKINIPLNTFDIMEVVARKA